MPLKVRNWQFLITWFRAGVDLPKKLFYKKVLFFTQLTYHLMCKLLKIFYMLSRMHICTFINYLHIGFIIISVVNRHDGNLVNSSSVHYPRSFKEIISSDQNNFYKRVIATWDLIINYFPLYLITRSALKWVWATSCLGKRSWVVWKANE